MKTINKLLTGVALSVSLALGAMPSYAQTTGPDENAFVTIGDLVNSYHSRSDFDRAFSIGYIAAVHDSVGGTLACVPTDTLGVLATDVIRAIETGIEKGTVSLNTNAAFFLSRVFVLAYPCDTSGTRTKRGFL